MDDTIQGKILFSMMAKEQQTSSFNLVFYSVGERSMFDTGPFDMMNSRECHIRFDIKMISENHLIYSRALLFATPISLSKTQIWCGGSSKRKECRKGSSGGGGLSSWWRCSSSSPSGSVTRSACLRSSASGQRWIRSWR